MSDEFQKRERALAYLELLDARRKELSSYAEDIAGSCAQNSPKITIDDFLLEAFELGDEAADDEIIHEAFLLRAEQQGLSHETHNPGKTLRQIRHKAMGRPYGIIARIAAVLVCVIAVSGITVGAAYAFNWTALTRIFDPVAETFGVTLNSGLPEVSKVIDTKMEEMNREWDMVPVMIGEYPSRLLWTPEGYRFSYSMMHNEHNAEIFVCVFADENDELVLTIHVFNETMKDAMLIIEKDADTGKTMAIGGFEVSTTTNIDYSISLWVDGNAAYKISGAYTEEDLEKMIKSIYGGI